MLGGAIGSLAAGILYDKLGPKKTLGLCIVGSVGATVLQFLGTTPAVLFIGLVRTLLLCGNLF
jgi:MFS family permease